MLGINNILLRTIVVILILFASICVSTQGTQVLRAADYNPARGWFEVKTIYLDLKDSSRDRDVPVKIYYPAFVKGGAETCSVIIFSHGLGGTRDGYEYLGRRWASSGYVSVHLQHIGSDDSAWKGNGSPMKNMRRPAMNPMNAINRVKDVRFVIDRLEAMNKADKIFRGRLNLNRIGVAGHSFGANTVMMIAGQRVLAGFGGGTSLSDLRVKAAIAMSAPVPKGKETLDKVYSGIRIPMMHMTGTKDDSPIGETKAADRRLPFDHIKTTGQYLVIFKGGDHMIFSGRPHMGFGDSSKDAVFQEYIMSATTAFWDAYLKNDSSAKIWLARGGFAKSLSGYGTFEKK